MSIQLVIEFLSISTTIFLFSKESAKKTGMFEETVYVAAVIIGIILGRIYFNMASYST